MSYTYLVLQFNGAPWKGNNGFLKFAPGSLLTQYNSCFLTDMNQMQFDGNEKVGKSLPCKHDFVLDFNVEVEVMEVK